MECTIFSIPPPERIVWTFNGREVDLRDQDYSILEDPSPEGIKSTLVIRESQEKHFGMYNCSVSNPYGSDVVEINLMQQSMGCDYWWGFCVMESLLAESVPSLIIIVGVAALVILVFIVVLVVFLCQKQNKKKAPPESEYWLCVDLNGSRNCFIMNLCDVECWDLTEIRSKKTHFSLN